MKRKNSEMANTCPSSSHIFLTFLNFEAPSPSLKKFFQTKKKQLKGKMNNYVHK